MATGMKNNWTPTKYSTICSAHFPADNYKPCLKLKKRILLEWAYPTIDVWRPSKDVDNSHSAISENAEKPEQNEDIPESKVIIARVYHYFKKEYEILKAYTGNSWQLNPLVNYLQRTAEATGLDELTVTSIVGHEKQLGETETRDEAVQEKDDEEELRDVSSEERNQHQDDVQTIVLKMEVEEENEQIGCQDRHSAGKRTLPSSQSTEFHHQYQPGVGEKTNSPPHIPGFHHQYQPGVGEKTNSPPHIPGPGSSHPYNILISDDMVKIEPLDPDVHGEVNMISEEMHNPDVQDPVEQEPISSLDSSAAQSAKCNPTLDLVRLGLR